MQECFNTQKTVSVIHYVNKIKEKKSSSWLMQKKTLNKTEHPLIIQNIQKLGIERDCFNIIKAIYEKPTANIIFYVERLTLFL